MVFASSTSCDDDYFLQANENDSSRLTRLFFHFCAITISLFLFRLSRLRFFPFLSFSLSLFSLSLHLSLHLFVFLSSFRFFHFVLAFPSLLHLSPHPSLLPPSLFLPLSTPLVPRLFSTALSHSISSYPTTILSIFLSPFVYTKLVAIIVFFLQSQKKTESCFETGKKNSFKICTALDGAANIQQIQTEHIQKHDGYSTLQPAQCTPLSYHYHNNKSGKSVERRGCCFCFSNMLWCLFSIWITFVPIKIH